MIERRTRLTAKGRPDTELAVVPEHEVQGSARTRGLGANPMVVVSDAFLFSCTFGAKDYPHLGAGGGKTPQDKSRIRRHIINDKTS